MNDNRNPNFVRGIGETDSSYYGRVSEHVNRIRWQSDGHRQWYTHKNPYGCWICEILQVAELLISEHIPDKGIDSESGGALSYVDPHNAGLAMPVQCKTCRNLAYWTCKYTNCSVCCVGSDGLQAGTITNDNDCICNLKETDNNTKFPNSFKPKTDE